MAPSTDWKEQIAEDEEARFEALATRLRALQRGRARGGPAARTLHVKSHGALVGTMEALADIPEHARQGLFRTPRELPVVIRFSNGAGESAHDDVQDVRGIAIKVIGVEGEKAIPALADALTQDFLLIQSDAFAFPTPETFVSVVEALSGSKLLALPRLIGALGTSLPGVLGRVRKGLGPPPTSVLDLRLHSGLPIRFGDYAAKLDLVPEHPAGEGQPKHPDRLARELEARVRAGEHTWTLRAQLFVDEAQTPIEDPTASWPEDVAPFVPVARIRVPAQDPSSAEGQHLAERVEKLSFDPWHALAEHRPIGAMMRARNAAYRESTQERGASPEPRSIEELTGA